LAGIPTLARVAAWGGGFPIKVNGEVVGAIGLSGAPTVRNDVDSATLRHEGYSSHIMMLSADESLPCDRPNLSKGYLAGTASEESNFLRSAKFYKDHKIDLHLGARVAAIDVGSRYVELANGSRHAYGTLLLATGADPVRLEIPEAISRTCTICARSRTAALLSRRLWHHGATW
jgi:NAD(P)H-nitrite reductase large subunit